MTTFQKDMPLSCRDLIKTSTLLSSMMPEKMAREEACFLLSVVLYGQTNRGICQSIESNFL
jgi:hypothetical protein